MDEPNANESLLHELALRLATYPGDPRVDEPQLLVGQIPPNLSIEVPIPEGSRILGSLLRSKENIDILLDCTLTPGEVVQFYKERLAAAGWNELETMRPMHGGFMHSGMPMLMNHIVFCGGTQGPAFTVNANEGKNSRTNVRIELNGSSEFSPCAQPNRMRQHMRHRDMQQLIPPLYPPKGARQQGGDGGGDGSHWHTSSTLEADADLPTLAAHYNGQLSKGGWALSGEGQAGPLAWSTWTFQDEDKEPWRGLFFILGVPGKEHRYVLEVRVDWDKDEDGGNKARLLRNGGGGFSWTTLGSIRTS